jgi:PCFT/HCP family folate transporter-like MFS transporter 1/3
MSDVEELDLSEEAPLLNNAHERAGEHSEDELLQPDEPLPSRPLFKAKRWQAQSPGSIILLLAIIKFSLATTGMLMLVPIYRLIEDALCHVYYEDDSWGLIEEMRCKVDDVQSQLAFLMGWLGLASSITSKGYLTFSRSH